MAADTGEVLARFQPITPAEAELVVRRLEEDDERTLDDVVAEVKAERVGPAARWDSEYVAQDTEDAAAPAGEPTVEEPSTTTTAEPDEGGLEGWVRTLVEGEDDDVAVWLAEHKVDEVLETVASVPEDLRPAAAQRVADAEADRGDAARSTLLGQLEKFTDTEED